MKNTQNNNEALEQFYIDEVLINPINKIVDNLKSGNYRDCDIKWLDVKLEKFIDIAAKTLGISGILPSQLGKSETFIFLNEYATKRYLDYFTNLLIYFKSF